MNKKKLELENAIKDNQDNVEELIQRYLCEYPNDYDIYAMKQYAYLVHGEIQKAIEIGLCAVQINPFNESVYYNLANAYEQAGEFFDAYKYYDMAFTVAENNPKTELCMLEKEELINGIVELIGEQIKNEADAKNEDTLMQKLAKYNRESSYHFGLTDVSFRLKSDIILEHYTDYWNNTFFVGYYNQYLLSTFIEDVPRNLLQMAGEFIRPVAESSVFNYQGDEEVLIPILVREPSGLEFTHKGKSYIVSHSIKNHFKYYRIKKETLIRANTEMIVGEPIKLGLKPKKKKLVMSIFVDGLSEFVIKDDFQKYMPYTYRYFSKGTVCNNAYSTSEWTYPALASFSTGLPPTQHMMLHNELNSGIPENAETIFEAYKKDGYYTTLISGEWRMTPNYGYLKGVDHYIYQHQCFGMNFNNVIEYALEDLEFSKECNHYLWCNLGNLHDVADGYDFSPSVQAKLPISKQVEDGTSQTSVKQSYSLNNQYKYISLMKRIDLSLHKLFYYIEHNYQDGEVVISLFFDHGQGYLIKPDEQFLSDGRSNVAFMFRGDGCAQVETDELMSSIDYKSIMCKLTETKIDANNTGNLPQVFGGQNREYSITESIHPGDVYRAAIHTKEFTFYIESLEVVQHDCRFNFDRYTIKLEDKQGNEFADSQIEEKYKNIIMDHVAKLMLY